MVGFDDGCWACCRRGICVEDSRSGTCRGLGRVRSQFLERAKEKLGLTAEQVDKIKGELKGEREVLHGLTSKFHEARVGLRNAIQAPDQTRVP
jgi:hypothetical protein